MEEVERTDVVIICPRQKVEIAQKNSYAIDMNRERNCYTYRGFRHIAWHCRNRGVGNRIGKRRRLEYGSSKNNRQKRVEERNRQNNLNGEGNLIVFD